MTIWERKGLEGDGEKRNVWCERARGGGIEIKGTLLAWWELIYWILTTL